MNYVCAATSCNLTACVLLSGRDKPVIKKALVELDGPVFGAYKQMRDKWALEDSYRSAC